MKTKDAVLELLERNRGTSLSGERIAGELGVSRNVVWRAIQGLRGDGYKISAVTNKGYRLSCANDLVSAEGIRPYLKWGDGEQKIIVREELDSTNRLAKELAVNGASHGTVVIADRQTEGKGRHGKAFFSPPGTGLYMSLLVRPAQLKLADPMLITIYAAVCTCEAIESTTGLQPTIKWVNDIFIDGRKAAGILTEAITDFESGSIHDIIVGVGINVTTSPDLFPDELKDCAGSLFPDGQTIVPRNQIAAEIINRLFRSESVQTEEILHKYKERLNMLNREAMVSSRGERYRGRTLDITPSGYLKVQKETGEIVILTAGEITVL